MTEGACRLLGCGPEGLRRSGKNLPPDLVLPELRERRRGGLRRERVTRLGTLGVTWAPHPAVARSTGPPPSPASAWREPPWECGLRRGAVRPGRDPAPSPLLCGGRLLPGVREWEAPPAWVLTGAPRDRVIFLYPGRGRGVRGRFPTRCTGAGRRCVSVLRDLYPPMLMKCVWFVNVRFLG